MVRRGSQNAAASSGFTAFCPTKGEVKLEMFGPRGLTKIRLCALAQAPSIALAIVAALILLL